MADMTPLADILNGDPADATDVQNNFQIIEAYINGTSLIRTDGTEVMAADLDVDSNKIVNLADGVADDDAVNKGQLDTATGAGAWTAFTPTLTQGGAVTKTNSSRYVRIGRTIHAKVFVSVTGAGGAGNIYVGLPVAAQAVQGVIGQGVYFDTSTGFASPFLVEIRNSASEVWLVTTQETGATWAFGQAIPNVGTITLAVDDTISFSVTYEAAS